MNQNIQFKNLQINIEQSSETVRYFFKGSVDDNFKQENIPRVGAKHIFFALDEIHNFNSVGIREWIHFMKEMIPLGEITFKTCSITMIDQINLVPDTLGSAKIESFQAPYFCSEHGELTCDIKVQEHLPLLKLKKAPALKCPTCQKNLEFDALEESYFLFAEDL